MFYLFAFEAKFFLYQLFFAEIKIQDSKFLLQENCQNHV